MSYLGGIAGIILGGWYCGHIMKTKSVYAARKNTIAIGGILIFLGLLGIIFVVNEHNPMTFIYIVGIVLF